MSEQEYENEKLDEANEELKRADHLIFVSLKYTRTCDVLKHIIDRLINAIDFSITALLDDLKEKGKIDDIPIAPIPRARLAKENFSDDEFIPEFCDKFMRFRKISKADFSRSTEFRRHVNMTVTVDDEEIIVNIDSITEDFKRTKEFFAHIANILEPRPDEY